jgi:uncharacterized DUF497 family protein
VRPLYKEMEFEVFEWDESKRLENLAKHKIDFEDVHDLFAIPFYPRDRIVTANNVTSR